MRRPQLSPIVVNIVGSTSNEVSPTVWKIRYMMTEASPLSTDEVSATCGPNGSNATEFKDPLYLKERAQLELCVLLTCLTSSTLFFQPSAVLETRLKKKERERNINT